jgi:hypothetical protein
MAKTLKPRGQSQERRETSPGETRFSATTLSQFLNSIGDMYVYGAICVLGFAIYLRSIFFGFTYFDDNVLILNNLEFLQDARNILTAFSVEVFHILHSSAAYYRPLLTISFIPDAIVGGPEPTMYHITNVVIHLIASCLVFTLLRKLQYSKDFAFFMSLVFVAHPVLTQAVAWIPGRNDSLLTVFVLASFITFIKYATSHKHIYLVSCIAFFACSLFTKETALVIPFMFFLYAYIRKSLEKPMAWRLGFGFFVSSIVWGVLRHLALKNPISMTSQDMVQSVFNNSPAAIQLLGKAFFPFNLSVLPIIQDTIFYWGILASVFIIVLFIVEYVLYDQSRKKNLLMMFFGILWFIIFLLPSFIRPNPSIVADFIEHRLYLPIIGLVIVIAESQLSRIFGKMHVYGRYGFGIVIVCVFVGINFVHSQNFSNKLVFWKNAATNSPHSPLAQRNLGAMYFLEKEYDLAEQYFKKSLSLNANEQMAHNNLGLIYMNRGQLKEAENEYKKELIVNPYYDNAHFNLGLLYHKMGKTNEAVVLWKKTLEINPDYTDAQRALDASADTQPKILNLRKNSLLQ